MVKKEAYSTLLSSLLSVLVGLEIIFFFSIMILIQEEVAPKSYNFCSPHSGPLYLVNKKRFRDWVGVEGVRGCVS